jgi:1-acyl-sn-glycerol-3-phosphate acyltransferase
LEVFNEAQKRINRGLSVCIFLKEEYLTTDRALDSFKDGAFRLAIEHQIPIVPITLADNKRGCLILFLAVVLADAG